jgi:hypothetical protein
MLEVNALRGMIFGTSLAQAALRSDAEVDDMKATGAVYYWSSGRLSRARRRRTRLNLLAWLRGRYAWTAGSPFGGHPLAA